MALVYSCCFWFSLRLGGILIGLFSIIQTLIILIFSSLAYENTHYVKDVAANWLKNMDLIYVQSYVERFLADPEKYLTLMIVTACLYIILCIFYIYGAYVFNMVLMLGYILGELIRLLTIFTIVISWLLILKENTMDIGLLIGASVGSGFILLGMFYLWVCAMSLPVLMVEVEREEQAATIAKLQQLVQAQERFRYTRGGDSYSDVVRANIGKPFYIR